MRGLCYWADEPPHLRQIVAGVHVDETQVVHSGVVHPVAGEAAVADAGIESCRRLGAVVAEGIVAGFRVRHESSARPTEGHDVAQVVGVGEVQRPVAVYIRMRLPSAYSPRS